MSPSLEPFRFATSNLLVGVRNWKSYNSVATAHFDRRNGKTQSTAECHVFNGSTHVHIRCSYLCFSICNTALKQQRAVELPKLLRNKVNSTKTQVLQRANTWVAVQFIPPRSQRRPKLCPQACSEATQLPTYACTHDERVQSQPKLCEQPVLKLHNLQLSLLRKWQNLGNCIVSTVSSHWTAPRGCEV